MKTLIPSPTKLLVLLFTALLSLSLISVSVNAYPYYPPKQKEVPPRLQGWVGKKGRAHAPKGAPGYVKKMIKAGNQITDKPYKWGGGHGSWRDSGYDCSGAVSYVLHKAGKLSYPMTSGSLAKWGKPGKNKWVTVYANDGHAYMVVANLRFDTSQITDGDKSGPGWSEYMVSGKGFKKRHP